MRHRIVVAFLWLHAGGIAAISVATSADVTRILFVAAPVACAAIIASSARVRASVRAAVAAAGLLTASAVGVHLSGGYIEAHVHFFVIAGVITLYQDWLPFTVAMLCTVVLHVTGGLVAPESMFNHPGVSAHPVWWAVIHSVFVIAAASTHLVGWRLSEQRFLDAVTLLPNRSWFGVRLEQALAPTDALAEATQA